MIRSLRTLGYKGQTRTRRRARCTVHGKARADDRRRQVRAGSDCARSGASGSSVVLGVLEALRQRIRVRVVEERVVAVAPEEAL